MKSKLSERQTTASGRTRTQNISLSETVYLAFKRDVVRGVLQPGDALTESDLADRYQTSRTPVREAAARLQAENFLQIVPSRGYFVTEISIRYVNDIYDFRAAVESAAAEFAAESTPDSEEFQRLVAASNHAFFVDDHESYVRFIEADTEFHLGIAKLTRNPLLVRAVADMRSHMERIMFASVAGGYFGERPMDEHRGILEAIETHDAALARERMRKHIFISKERVLRLATRGSRM